jgi:molybdopterin-binding protein
MQGLALLCGLRANRRKRMRFQTKSSRGEAGDVLQLTMLKLSGETSSQFKDSELAQDIISSDSWDSKIMPISARNQLEGKIAEVTLGDIMAHVVVRIGKSQIESVITRRSAEQLGLKKGDKVTVVIKSTEVMLEKN